MKYVHINEVVTGLNRGADGGEAEGTITPQQLVWGMDNEMYSVIGDVFTAKTQFEVDAILTAREDEQNTRLLRLEAIQAARIISNLDSVTIEQATAYILAQLDTTALDATGAAITDPATLASLVEMRNLIVKNRKVLLKMVPYLLK